MNQDPTKVPQALDVINPMENVVAQPEIVEPLKGGFTDASRMAADKIYRTDNERNASMRQGSQFINNNIT